MDTTHIHSHFNKIASMGGVGTINEVRIQGHVQGAFGSGALVAGNYFTENISAGIQYGATGYTPVQITTGSASLSVAWLAFAGGLPPVQVSNQLPGTSPLQAVTVSSRSVDFNVQCTVPIPLAGYDMWFCVGVDTTQAFGDFEMFYTWWVAWSD